MKRILAVFIICLFVNDASFALHRLSATLNTVGTNHKTKTITCNTNSQEFEYRLQASSVSTGSFTTTAYVSGGTTGLLGHRLSSIQYPNGMDTGFLLWEIEGNPPFDIVAYVLAEYTNPIPTATTYVQAKIIWD